MSLGLLILSTIEIALIFIGVIFLIVSSIVQKNENEKQKNCTIMTSGIITGIRTERFGSSSDRSRIYSYFPVYEYDTGKGRIQTTSNISINRKKIKIGQKICVYYNPYAINENYVPELKSKEICKIFKYVGILLLSIATIILVFGLLVLVALFY